MGRIGSTNLVLPKWHKYGTYNRHLRVRDLVGILFFMCVRGMAEGLKMGWGGEGGGSLAVSWEA